MLQFLLRNMAQCLAVAWCFLWQGNTVLSFDARASRTTPTVARFQKQYRDNDLIRSNASSLRWLHNDNENDDDENDENGSTNNTNTNTNNRNQRRIVIGSLLSVPLSLLIPTKASSRAAAAAENNNEAATKKPFAPLENLLPAIRVKFSIDSAIDLTRSLIVASERTPRTTNQEKNNDNVLSQLEVLLLKPHYVQSNLVLQGVPSKPADLYLKPYQSTKGDLPFQKAFIKSGDVDAWKRLKRREKALEQSNAIRQALNAYTDALSFSGDSYLLRVDVQTKSSMVREDRLPDIKQVITSDMGMRYLYRNQVLTAMDDVKAELEYQLKQNQQQQQQQAKEGSSSLDDEWKDLLDLLVLASEAMDRWMSLVPSEDVKEALKTVASEE